MQLGAVIQADTDKCLVCDRKIGKNEGWWVTTGLRTGTKVAHWHLACNADPKINTYLKQYREV